MLNKINKVIDKKMNNKRKVRVSTMIKLNVNAPIFVPSASLNVNAPSFVPDVKFDKLESDWWNSNEDMFEDSFNDIYKVLKGGLVPYEEVRGDRIFVKRDFVPGLSTIIE